MPRRQFQVRKVSKTAQGEDIMHGSCVVFADDESEAKRLGTSLLGDIRAGRVVVEGMTPSVPTDAEMAVTQAEAREAAAQLEAAGMTPAGVQDPDRYV